MQTKLNHAKTRTLNRTQGETIFIMSYPRKKENQYPRDMIKYSTGEIYNNPGSESKTQDFMQYQY